MSELTPFVKHLYSNINFIQKRIDEQREYISEISDARYIGKSSGVVRDQKMARRDELIKSAKERLEFFEEIRRIIIKSRDNESNK